MLQAKHLKITSKNQEKLKTDSSYIKQAQVLISHLHKQTKNSIKKEVRGDWK